MVKVLQALYAKGLTFLIIFGFFVENNFLENTKLIFLVSWMKSYVRPSHFCTEHISKYIEDNSIKLNTLIESHKENCKVEET